MKHKQQDLNFEKKGEKSHFWTPKLAHCATKHNHVSRKKTTKKNYEVANDSPASLFLAGQQSHPRDQS